MTRTADNEELARALDLYEKGIRRHVEAGHQGDYLVINLESGDYEMVADDLAASRRARARFPYAPLFTLRIGCDAAYRIGGRGSVSERI